MKLVPLNLPDLDYIVSHIREVDRAEISATRWDDSLDGLALDCMKLGRFSWIAGRERPIAAFGCAPLWPGVWSGWMFATDEIDKIGLPLTRFVKRVLIPSVKSAGGHRIEARSLGTHTDAHQWLLALGATGEGVALRCGKSGEDFLNMGLCI